MPTLASYRRTGWDEYPRFILELDYIGDLDLGCVSEED